MAEDTHLLLEPCDMAEGTHLLLEPCDMAEDTHLLLEPSDMAQDTHLLREAAPSATICFSLLWTVACSKWTSWLRSRACTWRARILGSGQP